MRDSVRRQIAVFIGAASLAVGIGLQIAIAAWAWWQATPKYQAELLRVALFDGVACLLIILGAIVGCRYLILSIRQQDQRQSRLTHLADLGILAGGLAHEIRNTLNAMHSQIALLRKQIAQGDVRLAQRAATLERAVVELEELVSQFLAFARPAKDQLQEVDLRQLIREVVDFAALDLEQGQITVILDLASDLPAVQGDPSKLKRALLNLVINARQAMPDGGRLTIVTRSSHRDILISVSDTGIGIPEENKHHIFETFFSTKPEGTGLGLAIVKRTAEDLGGRIEFDSKLGQGTTFRLYLPAGSRLQVNRPDTAKEEALVRSGGRS